MDLQVSFPDCKGRHVASLPLPRPVEVIAHDVDEVQACRQPGHIIRLVDETLEGGDSCREEQPAGTEGRPQLLGVETNG